MQFRTHTHLFQKGFPPSILATQRPINEGMSQLASFIGLRRAGSYSTRKELDGDLTLFFVD